MTTGSALISVSLHVIAVKPLLIPHRLSRARTAGRQDRGKAKGGKERRGDEARQGSDRFVLQREQLDGVSSPLGAWPAAAIESEGRLPVRGGRRQPEASAPAEPLGPGEERPDRIT